VPRLELPLFRRHLRRPAWRRLTRKEIRTEVGGGQPGSNRLRPSMRRPVSVKDVFLSCKDVFSFCFLFPSCGFLRIRAGPPLSPSFHPHSWLSDFRSVHGGRSQYSRCCYLIIDLGSRLSTEAGPGLRRSHLISAVELGCVDTISFLYAPFSFFRPFSVFRREISSQDRLATTIANSVDP
jgi:hypothetical protein